MATASSLNTDTTAPGLLVEDNMLVQQSLRHALNILGFPSKVAQDGIEAMEMLRSEPFSFVLMDVQMPGKGGIDVLLELRQLDCPNTQVPVVIMSGNESESVIAFRSGANEFLTKPISVKLLAETIQRLKDGKNSHGKDSSN
ncbi:Response regulator MprA [Novipirellula galeiformis]|uniref:Response regulator MprA n=1 Tax=Novipirellula galeiformis TaxID=2528004 RepID=A0A5C6BXT2_9BACT|nr:response regulator [Novipirellula galeiformis]TWU17113.1 Response regulator MprA [Novipirellula galeiformis]